MANDLRKKKQEEEAKKASSSFMGKIASKISEAEKARQDKPSTQPSGSTSAATQSNGRIMKDRATGTKMPNDVPRTAADPTANANTISSSRLLEIAKNGKLNQQVQARRDQLLGNLKSSYTPKTDLGTGIDMDLYREAVIRETSGSTPRADRGILGMPRFESLNPGAGTQNAWAQAYGTPWELSAGGRVQSWIAPAQSNEIYRASNTFSDMVPDYLQMNGLYQSALADLEANGGLESDKSPQTVAFLAQLFSQADGQIDYDAANAALQSSFGEYGADLDAAYRAYLVRHAPDLAQSVIDSAPAEQRDELRRLASIGNQANLAGYLGNTAVDEGFARQGTVYDSILPSNYGMDEYRSDYDTYLENDGSEEWAAARDRIKAVIGVDPEKTDPTQFTPEAAYQLGKLNGVQTAEDIYSSQNIVDRDDFYNYALAVQQWAELKRNEDENGVSRFRDTKSASELEVEAQQAWDVMASYLGESNTLPEDADLKWVDEMMDRYDADTEQADLIASQARYDEHGNLVRDTGVLSEEEMRRILDSIILVDGNEETRKAAQKQMIENLEARGINIVNKDPDSDTFERDNLAAQGFLVNAAGEQVTGQEALDFMRIQKNFDELMSGKDTAAMQQKREAWQARMKGYEADEQAADDAAYQAYLRNPDAYGALPKYVATGDASMSGFLGAFPNGDEESRVYEAEHGTTNPLFDMLGFTETMGGESFSMTEGQRNLFFKYYEEDPAKAAEYFSDLVFARSTQNQQSTQEWASESARKDGVGATIFDRVLNLVNSAEGVGSLIQTAANELSGRDVFRMSEYNARFLPGVVSSTQAEEVAKNIEEWAKQHSWSNWGVFNQNILKTMYQAFTSGVDSAIGMYTMGGGYTWMMGAGGFNQALQQQLSKVEPGDRDAYNNAVVESMFSGLVEVATEYVSPEIFFSDPSNIALYVVKNVCMEGLEEVNGDIAQAIWDELRGNEGSFSNEVDKLVAQGMTRSEAQKLVCLQMGEDIALSFTVGSLSAVGSTGRAAFEVGRQIVYGKNIASANYTTDDGKTVYAVDDLFSLATENIGKMSAKSKRIIEKFNQYKSAGELTSAEVQQVANEVSEAAPEASAVAEQATEQMEAEQENAENEQAPVENEQADTGEQRERKAPPAKKVMAEAGAGTVEVDAEAEADAESELKQERNNEILEAAQNDAPVSEEAATDALTEGMPKKAAEKVKSAEKKAEYKTNGLTFGEIGRVFREVMGILDEQAQDVLARNFNTKVVEQVMKANTRGENLTDEQISELASIATNLSLNPATVSAEQQAMFMNSEGARHTLDILTARVGDVAKIQKAAEPIRSAAGRDASVWRSGKAYDREAQKTVENLRASAAEAGRREAELEKLRVANMNQSAIREDVDRRMQDMPLSGEEKSVTSDGRSVSVQGATVENGQIMLRVSDESGAESTVSPASLVVGSGDVEQLRLAQYANAYGGETGLALYNGYVPYANSNYEHVSVDEYAKAFDTLYNYGRSAHNKDLVMNGPSGAAMTEAARSAAYELGRDAARKAAENQQKASAEKAKVRVKSGKKYGNVDVSALKGMQLTEHQKAAVSGMRYLAKAIGFNVEFFASEADENGNYKGENGSWNSDKMLMRLDIHAGAMSVADAGNTAIMQTAGHELTHYLAENASADVWQAYVDFVMGTISEGGIERANMLINSHMQHDPKLTREGAVEEVVADAAGDMLARLSEADLQAISELNPAVKRTFGQWITRFIEKAIARIRAAFAGTKNMKIAAEAMQNKLEEQRELFVKLILDAQSRRFSTEEAAQELLLQEVTNAVNAVEISENATAEEAARELADAAVEAVKDNSYDQAARRKAYEDRHSLAWGEEGRQQYIKEKNEYLDREWEKLRIRDRAERHPGIVFEYSDITPRVEAGPMTVSQQAIVDKVAEAMRSRANEIAWEAAGIMGVNAGYEEGSTGSGSIVVRDASGRVISERGGLESLLHEMAEKTYMESIGKPELYAKDFDSRRAAIKSFRDMLVGEGCYGATPTAVKHLDQRVVTGQNKEISTDERLFCAEHPEVLPFMAQAARIRGNSSKFGDFEKAYDPETGKITIPRDTKKNREAEIELHRILTKGYESNGFQLDGKGHFTISPSEQYVTLMATYEGTKGTGLYFDPDDYGVDFDSYANGQDNDAYLRTGGFDNDASAGVFGSSGDTENVKYEVRTVGKYTFVEADRQVISGDNPKIWGKQVERYINEKIRENQDILIPTTDGHILALTARSAYKLTDPHKAKITSSVKELLSQEEYRRKLDVASHIDELVSIARFRMHNEDEGGKHQNDIGEDGFNYYQTYFADSDGYYIISFSGAVNGEGETVYSIGRIKKRATDPRGGFSAAVSGGGAHNAVDSNSSGTIVYSDFAESQAKTAVEIALERAIAQKNGSSVKNSDRIAEMDADYLKAVKRRDMAAAQRLVDEAAEIAFADSKIRDEDGNLLAVYHGSDAEFNEFDRTKTRANMDIQGMFFSPWEDDSAGYGGTVRRFYLNITNPASESAGYKALNTFKGQNGAGVKARELLASRGYDGVNNSDEEYIAFEPNQIKLADPVTYDDAGNVIPLSERFNRESNDIRYELRDPYSRTDRETLATAFDDLARTEAERDLLKRYREKAAALEKKRAELKAAQTSLETKANLAGNKDRLRVTQANNRVQILEKQIQRMDAELMKFEQSRLLQAVVERVKQTERAKKAEAVSKVRAKRDEKLKAQHAEDRAHEKAHVEQVKESFSKNEYREELNHNLSTLREWVAHPTNKAYVPEFLRGSMGDFLENIDTSSKRMLSGGEATQRDQKLLAAMEDMRRALQRALNGQTQGIDVSGSEYFSGYLDLPEDYITAFDNLIESIRGTLSASDAITGTPLTRMNSAQLKSLNDLTKQLMHSIRSMDRLLVNAAFQHVSDAAGATITEMDAIRELGMQNKKLKNVSEFLNWKNTTPVYAFERMGEGGKAIFEGLQSGWDKLAYNAKTVIDFANEAYTTAEVKAWEKETHTFEIGDQTVTMTTAQLMSLYCLSNREQALRHILGGGIRVGEYESKRKTVNNVQQYHVNQKILNDMLGELTDRQIEVAQKLQGFMVKECADWGNEVSMRRFGYRMFTERNYFPIASDSNVLRQVSEQATETSMYRLLNLSATKELNANANNTLMVNDIFDVFTAHSTDMAKYNALALPILDSMKWLNYRERIENANGTITVNGVSKSLERVYGKAAGRYIKNLITDLNGATETARNDGVLANMLSHYKVAAVAANLRVYFLQVTSMPRAAVAINPKYLAKGLASASSWAITKGGTRAGQEAGDHVGIAAWKDLGFYDTNIGRDIREQIKHSDTAMDKVRNITMAPAGWADNWTMGVIYNAVRAELKDQGVSETSEDYEELLNRRVREIVYKTQVVDSTMTRSDMMRSKGMSNIWTAFMSEPTLTLSMLTDSIQQTILKRRKGMTVNQAIRANSKQLLRVWGVWAVSAVVTSLFEGVFSAVRDDDEYETFLQKLKVAWGQNFVDDVNILNNIPIVKDIFNILTGGSVDRMDMAAFADISDTIQKFKKAKWENGIAANWGAVYKLLQSASKLTGLPVGNAFRDGISLWNTFVVDAIGQPRVQTYSDSKGTYAEAYYNAMTDGNEALAAYILERAQVNGIDLDDFSGKVKTLVKDKLLSGKIDSAEAIRQLTEIGDLSDEKAADQVAKWGYTAQTGLKYDSMKSDFIAGDIDAQTAKEQMMLVGGKTESQADENIAEWSFERETGYKPEEIDDRYISGDITETEARALLKKKGVADIDHQIDQLDYKRSHGGKNATGYTKYWRMFDAFDAKNTSQMRSWAQKYLSSGIAKKDIAGAITSKYKPQYVTLKGTKAGDALRDRLLDMYEAIGYDRKTEWKKYMSKW